MSFKGINKILRCGTSTVYLGGIFINRYVRSLFLIGTFIFVNYISIHSILVVPVLINEKLCLDTDSFHLIKLNLFIWYGKLMWLDINIQIIIRIVDALVNSSLFLINIALTLLNIKL